MSVKFKVKMTEEYMTSFMFYHNYTRFSGVLSLVLGVGGIGLAVNAFMEGDTQSMALGFIIAVLFLIASPSTTKSRAKAQVKNSPMFQKPLEYELSEIGITVRQDEVEATNTWDEFMKVVSTKKLIVLYVNHVRALIFPKECMGEQYEEAVAIIRANMPAGRVKF